MSNTQIRIIDKKDFLKEEISKLDIKDSAVLDAGTGKMSAEILMEREPRELSCVTFTGDVRKGNKVAEILKQTGNENYCLIYGDLTDIGLFPENSFDLILADYLLGELEVGKVNDTFRNLLKWLKPDGKLFLVDREFYDEYKPVKDYISMGEVKGEAELSKRPDKDIAELASLFLNTPINISLLTNKQRNFDYPSEWVLMWLEKTGFEKIKITLFESEVNIKKEFSQRMEWAKQRIEKLENVEMKSGLLKEMEKLISELESRNISDDKTFLRKQYFIEAEKV